MYNKNNTFGAILKQFLFRLHYILLEKPFFLSVYSLVFTLYQQPNYVATKKQMSLVSNQ